MYQKILKAFKIAEGIFKTFRVLDQKSAAKDQFQHVLRELRYINNATRPEFYFNFSNLSLLNADDLRPRIIWYLSSCVKDIVKIGLEIIILKLDLESVYTRGYFDAAFARNKDLKLQLGIFIFLINNFWKHSTKLLCILEK